MCTRRPRLVIMQTIRDNNPTKFRNKIASEFWEIAVFVGDIFSRHLKIVRSPYLSEKSTGSTWGASANTLRSSALALCYSAAEYCAPDWSRSAHTSQVDVQLNSTMRLISSTLCSTPLPWLPVLSYIEPPACSDETFRRSLKTFLFAKY